jgi:hypothetical protein
VHTLERSSSPPDSMSVDEGDVDKEEEEEKAMLLSRG